MKTTKKTTLPKKIKKTSINTKKTSLNKVKPVKKIGRTASKIREDKEVKVKVQEKKSNEKKPKMAIISLTSCEGCQFALLDLGTRFFDLAEKVEMVDFRLIEDEEDPGTELDLVLIEGNPVTEDNMKTLLEARKRAKVLVALGNCAAMGGIPEIKNYQEGTNTIKHVYRYLQGIYNPPIQEIGNFVKVDFVFRGCPINGEEFLKHIDDLLAFKIPEVPDQPVCIECKKKGNRCLLLDKKPCFGPMIYGGCDAVCPTARMTCQGCRGLRPGGNIKAMRATLKTMISDAEFENITEIYGLRDDIEEKERRQKIV